MNAQCHFIDGHCVTNNNPKRLTFGVSTVTKALAQRGRQFFSELQRKHKEKMALKQLARLDDTMLRDVGISRADIHWAIAQPSSINATTELEILARRTPRRY